jgi:hypothetical protein
MDDAPNLINMVRLATNIDQHSVVVLACSAFPAVLERDTLDKLDQLKAQLLCK